MGRPRTRSGIDLLEYRVRMLPSQLDRARKRVRDLESEAIRIGLPDLVASQKRLLNGSELV